MRAAPLLAALFLAPFLLAADSSEELFESRIRPALAKNCFACHSTTAMAGLNLTTREGLIKGGRSGPALIPGKPDDSLFIQAIRYDHEKLKMPPSGKLTSQEVTDLTAWVTAGAVWPARAVTAANSSKTYNITPEQRAFWSFQPVRPPSLPDTKDQQWARNNIDRFLLAKMEAQGLHPVGPASKANLLRRVTFDLTGLPPTPAESAAFLSDESPNALATVVDRLLASPRYGERWGRYWLDVARYSDDKLSPQKDDPYPNAFRYRDWVIKAFNDDLPYNQFLQAQLAGDQLDKEHLAAGTGFYALSPEFQEDRVDATTRGFLGLTVACAQCHDHKFDPIPTQDYYSLLGIFKNTRTHELPLAPAETVKVFTDAKAKLESAEKDEKEFLKSQSESLSRILAARAAEYLTAAWQVTGPSNRPLAEVVAETNLDGAVLARLVKHWGKKQQEYPYLQAWLKAQTIAEATTAAQEFQTLALRVEEKKRELDIKNLVRLGGSLERENLAGADLLSLPRDEYFLWTDLFGPGKGIFWLQESLLLRHLHGDWQEHAARLRTTVASAKAAMPPQYPFLHTIQDVEKPAVAHVYIRGSADNLGEESPPHFLKILSTGEAPRFKDGNARRELAAAIADPGNPLTARVIVNRVWAWHFGQGIVRTTSNFGQLGERPSHPELLDYLASQFVKNGWSLKQLHREIVLSAAYGLSTQPDAHNATLDADNRFLWRANLRRLDVEALRDAMLDVSGELRQEAGGPPERLDDPKNRRRTVYCFVSRRSLDPTLSLFDFANPNSTSEGRTLTSTPLQRLFFLNSPFVMDRGAALAARLQGDDAAKIQQAYQLLYSRPATEAEAQLGLQFLQRGGEKAWPRYAQVLLSANEFQFVN